MVLGLTYSFSIISGFIVVAFGFLVGNDLDRYFLSINTDKTKIKIDKKENSNEEDALTLTKNDILNEEDEEDKVILSQSLNENDLKIERHSHEKINKSELIESVIYNKMTNINKNPNKNSHEKVLYKGYEKLNI